MRIWMRFCWRREGGEPPAPTPPAEAELELLLAAQHALEWIDMMSTFGDGNGAPVQRRLERALGNYRAYLGIRPELNVTLDRMTAIAKQRTIEHVR